MWASGVSEVGWCNLGEVKIPWLVYTFPSLVRGLNVSHNSVPCQFSRVETNGRGVRSVNLLLELNLLYSLPQAALQNSAQKNIEIVYSMKINTAALNQAYLPFIINN